jgi:hypothetical protein
MEINELDFNISQMELYAGWNDRSRWSYDILTLSNVFTLDGLGDWTLERWLFE